MKISGWLIKSKYPWETDSYESIWTYLIEHGETDRVDRTNDCLKGIKDIGIDWGNTEIPATLEIVNTDTNLLEVYLEGILVLNDCRWYKWRCTLIPPDHNLNSVLSMEELIERKLR